jgi:hypothetical protein
LGRLCVFDWIEAGEKGEEEMNHWVHIHQFLAGALSGSAAGWLFSALVTSMPDLPPNAGWWAKWIYAALHLISANLSKSKPTISA